MQHSQVSPVFKAQVWGCFTGGRSLFCMRRKSDTEDGCPWATDGLCLDCKREHKTGSWWRGQHRVRGRTRTGLQASSQRPHNWKERWEGAVPQGVGGLGKPVREQQLLLHLRARLVLSQPRCRCLHQPASPGSCLKLAPGAGLAGSCSAPECSSWLQGRCSS